MARSQRSAHHGGPLPHHRRTRYLELDFLVGLACGYGAGILSGWPYGFFIKAGLFRRPLGPLLRALVGIPIDRSAPHHAVHGAAEILRTRPRCMLAITPERTRRRTERWRTGFYYIARNAGVPVAFDYAMRECRIGPAVEMTGDAEADLELFRRFYAGARRSGRSDSGRVSGSTH